MPEPIRVLIVDDQRLMRVGPRTLLELSKSQKVRGASSRHRPRSAPC